MVHVISSSSYLGWGTLDHQVNFRDVQSTGCDIGGNENLESPLPEALQGGFALFLRNVTMEGLGTLGLQQTIEPDKMNIHIFLQIVKQGLFHLACTHHF